jgi:hypothetical protein
VWYLVPILALAAALGDATATKLDGSTVTGAVQSWQDGQLTLASTAGPVEVAEADLLTVEFSPADSAPNAQSLVELVDGTVVPVADFLESSGQIEIGLLAADGSEPQKLAVPLKSVRVVRLQPLDATLEPQWQEIHAVESPSDVLIVRKREGKSLDYLEGVVEEITKEDVAFRLDDDVVRVPRAKVTGVVYHRPVATTPETPRCLVKGSQGLHVAAKAIELDGDQVRFTTMSGVQFAWPLADLRSADFSAGKVLYISDLEPVSQAWQPLVSLPERAKFAARYGRPRLDRSAAGGPLALFVPDAIRSDAPGRVQKFVKGLALRSRTEYVVRLPSGYSRFLAVAGIDPSTQTSGNVMLSIFGDDRLLIESPVVGESAPLPIELDVNGVKRLRVVVDYGQNLDTGDWLNLCNARIVK